MTLVSTVNVGSSGASSIEWSSIAQTGKDLLVLFSGRSDLGGVAGGINIRFNSDSGTNYEWIRLVGSGTTVSSSKFAAQTAAVSSFSVNGSPATSSTFSNVSIYIPNYTSGTSKVISMDTATENGNTEAYVVASGATWTGTSAINTVTLSLGGNFTQYTSASLYIIS